MISHKHKCIFIHPNRNGGKSIEKTLFETDPVFGSADHSTILQWKNKTTFDVFNSYFKFVFCRNPWDRLVSIYHYTLENWKDLYPNHKKIPIMFSSFETFVKSCKHNKTPTKSQSHFIKINGEVAVDYIGRFENYSKDWGVVCNYLNISLPLPHLNYSQHYSYTKYYTPELVDIVAKEFREDIRTFLYEYPE